MKLNTPITIEREPDAPQNPVVPLRVTGRRSFQPPDAAMPGPIARLRPIDPYLLEDGSGGGEFFEGGDDQNQDRI